MKRYISNEMINKIKEVIKIAYMETAGFSKTPDEMFNIEYTEEVKRNTALWRKTWIIYPLQEIIDKIEENKKQ